MRVGSLFSGCGGLDLGLEAAGHEIVWACENDPDCRAVLADHHPDLLVVDDVRNVGADLPPVEGLAGGFPCTDLSVAGKRAGIRAERSGLWAEFFRAVCELRPRAVLVENVPGLLGGGDWLCVPCGFYGQPAVARFCRVEDRAEKLVRLAGSWCPCCDERLDTRTEGTLFRSWMGVVVGDLAEAGYVGRWVCLRAADVGAPHLRERVFIFAWDASADAGGAGVDADGRVRGGDSGGGDQPGREAVSGWEEVAHAADAFEDRAGAVADAAGAGLARPAGELVLGGGGRSAGRGGEDREGGELLAAPDAAGVGRLGRPGLREGEGEAGDARLRRGRSDDDGGEDAADADLSGPQGEEPEGRRDVSAGGGGEAAAVAGDEGPSRAGGDAQREGAVVVSGNDGPEGQAAADAGREPGQPGGGRGVARGDRAWPGAEEPNGDGLDGPAEQGEAVGAAADADSAGRGGVERAEPGVGPRADADGRGRLNEVAADAAGLGRDGGEAGEGGDASAGSAPERAEGDADAGDGGGVEWGAFEPAVRRWELALGRDAPRPTDDRGRLNPDFVEWMLGFPPGWTEGVKRTARLRMLGNAVQVQVGELAGRLLG